MCVLLAVVVPGISANSPNASSAITLVSSWAVETVHYADNLGLIPTSWRSADLRHNINRGEFAALMVALFEYLTDTVTELPQLNQSPYTDTSDPEIYKARAYNLMIGTSATEFSPQMLLNRETAASALANLLRRSLIPGWQAGVDYRVKYEMPPVFADDADISPWARESVYLMTSLDIIRGMPDHIFAPRNLTTAQVQANTAGATREQAIIMAARIAEKLKGAKLDVDILSLPDDDINDNCTVYNVRVPLYLPNESKDGFVVEWDMSCGHAEHIVSLLVKHGAYPLGVALQYFNFTGKYGYADMNPTFGYLVSHTGTTGEYLYFGCLVNTLLECYDLDEIDITVEGEIIETGHNTYDRRFTFYGNRESAGDNPGSYLYPDEDGRLFQHPSDRLQGADLATDLFPIIWRSDGIDAVSYILKGIWTASANRFVDIVTLDPGYDYWFDVALGLLDTEYAVYGKVRSGSVVHTGGYIIECYIDFPERPPTELYDGTPAFTVLMQLDCANLHQDGKIQIRTVGHGEDEWVQYAFAGMTMEAASNNR